MIVIGVTGGSGSGKSSFTRSFAELCDAPVIDADAVYHDLISSPSDCTAALARTFGKDILYDDGSLNRPALAQLVFGSDEASDRRRAQLNEITHAFVRAVFEERLAAYRAAGVTLVLLDVPLLFESDFHLLCDRTVCILANYETRFARITGRDKITEETARRRLNAQPKDDFYIAHSDYVVYNNACEATLKDEALRLAKLLGFHK